MRAARLLFSVLVVLAMTTSAWAQFRGHRGGVQGGFRGGAHFRSGGFSHGRAFHQGSFRHSGFRHSFGHFRGHGFHRKSFLSGFGHHRGFGLRFHGRHSRIRFGFGHHRSFFFYPYPFYGAYYYPVTPYSYGYPYSPYPYSAYPYDDPPSRDYEEPSPSREEQDPGPSDEDAGRYDPQFERDEFGRRVGLSQMAGTSPGDEAGAAPREILVTVNGQVVPSDKVGPWLLVGSGRNTVRISARDDSTVPRSH
jgi:hypothetical protein